jgi:LysR family transcriptional regulator, hydrogen peroxide-inducible genes activator
MAVPPEKPPRVSLRQLEYFVAVSQSHSFRRAAEKLGVSQPTLTSQIASLEQAIGARLFERGRSGTIQSPVGRELLRDARRVLEEFEGFLDRAHALTEGPGGTYRLGVARTVGPYLLPHILPSIHRDYSAVKFYVREDVPNALEDALLDGRYDLIITTLPIGAVELSHVTLCREPLKLVVSIEHKLARKTRIDEADLAGEEVLAIEESHPMHSQIQHLCERFGAAIRRDYEGTSLDTLRQMVLLGMGISFLPALYVHSEIRSTDSLRVIPITGEGVLREHALVWRSTSPSRALFRELAERMRLAIRATLAEVTLPVG